MGLIGRILGLGEAAETVGRSVKNVAEVFVPNKTREQEMEHLEQISALKELEAEYASSGSGGFHQFVDGMNRLPRPALALGTCGLFIFAMVDPDRFSERMVGLDLVPDPLWWLLGAIVSFYFGARELHYQRGKRLARGKTRAAKPLGPQFRPSPLSGSPIKPTNTPAQGPDYNAALEEWRHLQIK